MAAPLDLRGPKTKDGLILGESGPPWTPTWATIARPFAYFVLFLVAAVIFVPFLALFVQALRSAKDAAEGVVTGQIIDWAKTVLAPVVGFGSAVIGYYFGARNGTPETPSDDTPANSDNRSDPKP